MYSYIIEEPTDQSNIIHICIKCRVLTVTASSCYNQLFLIKLASGRRKSFLFVDVSMVATRRMRCNKRKKIFSLKQFQTEMIKQMIKSDAQILCCLPSIKFLTSGVA